MPEQKPRDEFSTPAESAPNIVKMSEDTDRVLSFLEQILGPPKPEPKRAAPPDADRPRQKRQRHYRMRYRLQTQVGA